MFHQHPPMCCILTGMRVCAVFVSLSPFLFYSFPPSLLPPLLPSSILSLSRSNVLEWHYVLSGPSDSVYAGGVYHGKLVFPPQYPFKPPSILMSTPNGRFKVDTRLCLSMSDFHPESWNPLWSVSSILSGLLSFMLEKTETLGSIDTTDEVKREFAKRSLEANCKNAIFKKLYPHWVERLEQRKKEQTEAEKNSATATPICSSSIAASPLLPSSAAATSTTATAAASSSVSPVSAPVIAAAATATAAAAAVDAVAHTLTHTLIQ